MFNLCPVVRTVTGRHGITVFCTQADKLHCLEYTAAKGECKLCLFIHFLQGSDHIAWEADWFTLSNGCLSTSVWEMQSGVELDLIERLKKKQVEQQQALQELQEAMALTSRSGPEPHKPNPHNPRPHSPHVPHHTALIHVLHTLPLYTVPSHRLCLHVSSVVVLLQYIDHISLPVALGFEPKSA